MRSSSTHCQHLKPLNFGLPPKPPDEKLEFVEHVLGVLIESRFGTENPYSRLGEQAATTGNSQMFVNVTLLTASEIEAHLKLAEAGRVPFYVPRLRENHLRKRGATPGEEPTFINECDDVSDTSAQILAQLKPPAHAGGSPARGSPMFLGRLLCGLSGLCVKNSESHAEPEENAKRAQKNPGTCDQGT